MRKYYSNRLLKYKNQLMLWLVMTSFVSLQSQVSLTASGGATTATYTTVSQAFDSINIGKHSGAIVLTITANTVEPLLPTALLAPLAANGYTSVLIVPDGVRTIGVTNLNINRGIIQLFGAKNVTIDGDDPGSAGVDRSLTIGFNAGTGSFVNTAVIRIGSVSATVFPEDITIKNCNIVGPRPLTTNNSFNVGICLTNNSTATISGQGINTRNVTIENNNITKCFYGIFMLGTGDLTGATHFSRIWVKNNLIGITAVADNFVGRCGIYAHGASKNAVGQQSIFERNEIRVGNLSASGIDGIFTSGIFLDNSMHGLSIRYNVIRDIYNNTNNSSTGGLSFNTTGIFVFGQNTTDLDIHNNIIRDVVSARKQVNLGQDANYGIFALDYGSIKINHNTIGLRAPNYVGTTANTASAGIFLRRSSTAVALPRLLEYNNNIIVNQNASINAVCFGTSEDSLVLNTPMDKNCYYYPNGNAVFRGTNNTLLSLPIWQAATSRELNSFIENPPFVSGVDLHLQAGAITQLESNALVSAYSRDVDSQFRPIPTDIGADEFGGVAYIPPVILNVSHSPTTQSCATATARTISVNFSVLGNAVDSVMLEYNVNGGATSFLRLNSVSPLGFNRLVPAVTPLNGIVRYRVFVLTKVGDTIFSQYNYYNDNTASRALMPTLTSNPTQACVSSVVQLSHSFSPDPTGFIFPPNVLDTFVQTNITNIKLTTIDNTTPTANSLVGTMATATGMRGAYSNFRQIAPDTFGLGKSYRASMTSSTNVNAKLYMAAFVDFNGDGNFNGSDEMVMNSSLFKTIGTRTELFNIYIPPSARPGKTCIRYICSHAPILNAFNDVVRGEVEDYSIYIRPLTAEWKTGVTLIGSNNPQSYTIASLPATIYLELTDSAGCNVASNPLSITASPSGMNVTLIAPTAACYNVPVLIRANVTGGCAPYTYSWSNNASLNAPSQIVTLLTDTLFLTVTVTDRNGANYSRTGFILPNNPRLTVPDTTIICNRGTARITATTVGSDSAYWYQSFTSSPFNFDFQGRTYTTPTLNSTRDFYVAASRSSADSVGKTEQSGVNVTNTWVPLSGILFDALEPVIIRNCWMYVTGPASATINVGLLDKYGTIIAQTGNISPTYPVNINTPTLIPLNFTIPTADTSFKLVLLSQNGLTGIRRHQSGYAFPFSAAKPLFMRRSYSIPIPTATDYFYFYNIRVLKGVCVGQKERTTAKVTPPRVPSLFEDLKYTLLCKDDTLNIKVKSDTLGNRFVWIKDGIVIQNFSVTPPSDTFNDSFYRVPISKPSDTGLYQVKIYSNKFCTRDTFSREVRVSFHEEPKFIKDLSGANICLFRGTNLSVTTQNASTFKWYKDTVNFISGSDTTIPNYAISNASFTETGTYHVVVTDSNKCRDVKSKMVRVVVHDTPRIVSQPIDTTVCVGLRYVIKSQTVNALTYQWYKDNGVLNNFVRDSITLFSSKISDSGKYRIVAYSYPGCPEAISDVANLKVNPSPQILGFYPSELRFCEGQKIKLESSSLNKSGIEWFKDGSSVSNIDSFVTATAKESDTGKYSFVVKALNKCKDLNSDTMKVRVFKKPTVFGSKPTYVDCQDGELKFGFGATNGKIWQWLKNGVPVQGLIDSQLWLRFLTDKDNGVYSVEVNSDPVCPKVTSNSFTIDIKSKPVVTLNPLSKTGCLGENIQLISNGNNGASFQWYKNGSPVTGALTSTLAINGFTINDTGKYWLRIVGTTPCLPVNSDTAFVRFRSGQTNATVSLVSAYNLVEQCTDKDNWTYYATLQEPHKYLFAVNKNGNNMVGSADIVVRPNTFVSVHNTSKEYTASLMLKRFWNYKLVSGTITNPIDVKFYLNKSELDELDDKKDEIESLYDKQLILENKDVRWFKTKNVPFTNALLGGVRGNRFNFDSVIFTQYINDKENGVDYFTLKDIQDIGGGTAVYMFKGGTRYLGSIQNGKSGFMAEISPNPNKGQFNLLVLSKTLGKTNIIVVNNIGQTVYSSEFKLTSSETDIPMSIPNLANGMYQLILSKDDIQTSIKLQIEN